MRHSNQQLKLDSVLSEKLLKAFALFEKGIGVFGSPQAFHDWLNQTDSSEPFIFIFDPRIKA